MQVFIAFAKSPVVTRLATEVGIIALNAVAKHVLSETSTRRPDLNRHA